MIENVVTRNGCEIYFSPGPINEKQVDDRFPASMIRFFSFFFLNKIVNSPASWKSDSIFLLIFIHTKELIYTYIYIHNS